MKVLHLISGGDVGGAKVQVLTLVKNLQDKNISVKIICFAEGIFYEEAKDMGLDVRLMLQNSRLDMSVLKKLRKIVKEEKFSLVHCHGARANMIGVLLKRKINVPIITTMHSDYRLDFKDNFYKRTIFTPINALSLRFMDHYITISEQLRNEIIKRGFPANKISYVFNGLDFENEIRYMDRNKYFMSNDLVYNPDYVYVGILARLHPVKGHKVLLRAAKEVLDTNSNVRFLIGGDGAELNNLKKLSTALGLDSYVYFLGYVDKPYDFLNSIDINLLTSYSETFPYALLEGANMKKATISSKVGGIPKLIIDGKTGLLFEPGAYEELAEKMKILINSEKKRSEMGGELFTWAKENYSSTKMAEEYIKIYRRVNKDGKGPE
ncbi:MAG TPA: glycosyltransferase family 4 protein [Clostridia bacterium]|nr:glycosyltransferase family 4 protein [Clostridia bacterium]